MELINGAKKITIPDEIPIMPLRNTVVFPYQIIPLLIGREKSIDLIKKAIETDKIIGLVAQRNSENDDPKHTDLFQYGTVATILKMFDFPDGNKHVVVQGISRIKILEYTSHDPYFYAKIKKLDEKVDINVTIEALMVNLKNLVQKAVDLSPYLSSELGVFILNSDDPQRISDLVVSFLNISLEEKEDVLETTDVKTRLEKVTLLLNKEMQVLELGKKLQSEIQGEIEKTQRDYYLREQMKAIQRELGEDDERTTEIKELKSKIEKSKMPKEVRTVAEKELDRLSKIPPAAAEYTVARTYLDWLIETPWGKNTKDNLNITQAAKILDEDHYGLDKIKKEYWNTLPSEN